MPAVIASVAVTVSAVKSAQLFITLYKICQFVGLKKKEVTTIVCVFLRKAPTKNQEFEYHLHINKILFPLSDIMDLRHQSSAMCIITLGGEDTHPWSATNVGNPILATIPVTKITNKLLIPATIAVNR